MGAEIGALAISHLEEISDQGIKAMVTAGSIGVVLPTTAYILRIKPPPVRKMIDAGMAVALGSDYNPNAHCSCMVRIKYMNLSYCSIFRTDLYHIALLFFL